MSRAAHLDQNIFKQVEDACEQLLVMTVSQGGPHLDQILDLFPGVDTGRPGKAVHGRDHANPLLVVQTNGSGFDLPAFYLAQFAVITTELWIYSLPMLQHVGKPFSSDLLTKRFARQTGPHPLFLEQSLDIAHEFMRQQNAEFIRAAEDFLEIVQGELDPYSPTSWS